MIRKAGEFAGAAYLQGRILKTVKKSDTGVTNQVAKSEFENFWKWGGEKGAQKGTSHPDENAGARFRKSG